MKESLKLFVSRRGYQKLLNKVGQIRDERSKLEAEMGASAKADPDLRENPEFMDLRTRIQTVISRQLIETHVDITNAVVIEDQPFFREADLSQVFIGAKVIVSGENEKQFPVTILGPVESNPKEGIVSYLSPFGVALLGKMVGDSVSIESQDGQWTVRIESIDRGLDI